MIWNQKGSCLFDFLIVSDEIGINETEGKTLNSLKETEKIWSNFDHLEDDVLCE